MEAGGHQRKRRVPKTPSTYPGFFRWLPYWFGFEVGEGAIVILTISFLARQQLLAAEARCGVAPAAEYDGNYMVAEWLYDWAWGFLKGIQVQRYAAGALRSNFRIGYCVSLASLGLLGAIRRNAIVN